MMTFIQYKMYMYQILIQELMRDQQLLQAVQKRSTHLQSDKECEFINRCKIGKTGQYPQEHNLHFYEQALLAVQLIFSKLTSVSKRL